MKARGLCTRPAEHPQHFQGSRYSRAVEKLPQSPFPSKEFEQRYGNQKFLKYGFPNPFLEVERHSTQKEQFNTKVKPYRV